ncbi:MAG: hypothetical protein LBH01_01145 [Verrucomicrobiales bacterium]|jgi:hypothetical protein|nr:hypothetical protein [Verrucomicrobiales bacterium]
MKIAIGMFLLMLLSATGWSADYLEGDIQKLILTPAKDMERAELYSFQGTKQLKAILILSPGYNQSGENLVRDAKWQQFARQNGLGLLGLSFASEPELFKQERGYYYASQGSGEVLLSGINKIHGDELPLLLYGFSGGAQFTSRFVEWKPGRVLAWCAYSAAWWDEPKSAESMPPGIVACGARDERLGASLLYFKQGRAAGKPWLWVEVADTGHRMNAGLDEFVRQYFAAFLKNQQSPNPRREGVWLDIDRLEMIPKDSEHPALTGWLPDRKLFRQWQDLNRNDNESKQEINQ